MKKILITLLCAMCICSMKAVNYVDLGLPSGTLWAVENEEGFYTYDDAVAQFGSALPTDEQFVELVQECQWSWNGNGYTIVGPNGESLIIPAAGHVGVGYNGRMARLNGTVVKEGEWGRYWSSSFWKKRDGTIDPSRGVYCLSFESDQDGIDDGFSRIRVSAQKQTEKYPVRLVHAK